MMERSGGEILLAALKAYGCDRIFGVPGESYLPLLDAIFGDPTVDFITCRHEAGACNMAEADARLTGRPGVCAVSRGPGAMHAAIGIHTAQQDATPLILLVGQVPLTDRGRGAFQEMDYRAVFGSIAKHVVEVEDPADLPAVVEAACRAAMSGRRGPVVLSLPEDMLSATSDVMDRTPAWPPPIAPEASGMAKLAAMLERARRPLLVVGGSGWTDAACDDIAAFATRQRIPILSGFRCQDIVSNDHPLYGGELGFGLAPTMREAVEASDLLLVVGEPLGDICTQGYTLLEPTPRQSLVQVLPSADDLGRVFRPDLAMVADVAPFARQAAALAAGGSPERSERCRSLREAYLLRQRIPPPRARVGFADPADIMAILRDRLSPDTIVTNGAGNYTGWISRYHRYVRRGTQLAPVSGAMGYGLPAAIAAKLRHPSRPVIAFAGDGCFMMAITELATAMQYGVAMTVIVFDNASYGSIAMHQARQFGDRSLGTALLNPDFESLARSFGARSQTVTSGRQFAAAYDAFVATGGLAVIHVLTDPAIVSVDSGLPQAPEARHGNPS